VSDTPVEKRPQRPDALRRLMESAAPGTAPAPEPSVRELEPEDWSAPALEGRLIRAEKELAQLRQVAESHRRFLDVLENQPELFYAADPAELVQSILQAVLDLVGAERAAYFWVDARARLRIKQSLPGDADFDNISRSVVRDAMLHHRTFFHLGGQDLSGMERSSILNLGLKTVVAVPMEAEGRFLGVLYADAHQVGQLTPSDIPALEMLTRLSGAAMLRLDQLHEAKRKRRKLEMENQELKSVIRSQARMGRLVAESPAMKPLVPMLKRVARLKSNLWIEGETGTGKEFIARVLHEEGPWSDGEFVTLDCSTVPESLIESVLFGSIKGAFTDSIENRMGVIEEASGGTLLLDEIGDLPLGVQVKLLRVLDTREVRRVGYTSTPRKVDFRLIVASHRTLAELVSHGLFRKDLYYRTNVLHVRIPPLRDRREDILSLAESFIDQFSRENGMERPRLSAQAARKLLTHSWPGNVRELQKTVERSLGLREPGPVLDPDELLIDEVPGAALGDGDGLRSHLRGAEREWILRALKSSSWRVSAAARRLGISRKTLYQKIKLLEIESER